MNTEKAPSSTPQQESSPNPTKNPSLQFGLSVAIGVITLLLLASSYYYGIFHG